MSNQTAISCGWCGKFVLSVDEKKTTTRLYEIFTDESGRLVRDKNDAFFVASEHRCKATCGTCGKSVILENGIVYDRPCFDESTSFGEREAILRAKSAHYCKGN
jgi:endogenous inhibitor of DNA gyrase (YacG/DUF329 family)